MKVGSLYSYSRFASMTGGRTLISSGRFRLISLSRSMPLCLAWNLPPTSCSRQNRIPLSPFSYKHIISLKTCLAGFAPEGSLPTRNAPYDCHTNRLRCCGCLDSILLRKVKGENRDSVEISNLNDYDNKCVRCDIYKFLPFKNNLIE